MKKSFIKRIILLFLIFFTNISHISARQVAFYNDCLTGSCINMLNGMSMINNTDTFFVGGVNSECHIACDKKCRDIFGRKSKENPEFNADVIYRCITACQNGKEFVEKHVLKEKNYENFTKLKYATDKEVGVVDIQKACVIENPTVHKANFVIDTAEFKSATTEVFMRISLIGSAANKIYLKGKKIVKMYPFAFFINDAFFKEGEIESDFIEKEYERWNESSTQKNALSLDEDNFGHACSISSKGDLLALMSNKNLVACAKGDKKGCVLYDKKCNSDSYSDSQCPKDAINESRCYSSWNIRNDGYTDVGINISSGDELSITWSGDVVRQLKGIPIINYLTGGSVVIDFYMDYKIAKIAYSNKNNPISFLLPKKYRAYSASSVFGNSIEAILKQYGVIDVKNLRPLIGEEARKSGSNDKVSTIVCGDKDSIRSLPSSSNPKWYGLNGAVMDGNTSYSNFETSAVNDNEITSCNRVNDTSIPRYHYSGVLEGIAENTKFALKHHRNGNPDDFLGGYNVDIEWGGQPIKDGTGLQYALVKNDVNGNVEWPSDGDWKNLDFGGNKDVVKISLTKSISDQDGKYSLFFRINPSFLKDDGTGVSNIKNAIGAYNIGVSYPSLREGVGVYILRQISKIFLNTDDILKTPIGSHSLFEEMYSNITFYLRPLAEACSVLYLAITGFFILSGLTEVTIKTFVKQALKLSMVILFVSERGWILMSEYIIPLCINSGLKFASLLSPFIDPITGEVTISPYATNILELLGGFLGNLTDGNIWSRIGALATSSVLGVSLSIMIIIALLYCTITILKVIVIYIISIMGVIFLLLCAPVFIIFTLFDATYSYFEYWYKAIISFTLYPVFIFSASSFFYVVITFLLNVALNFTACKACFLYIPFIDYCLIESYAILLNSHVPSSGGLVSFFTPTGIAEASISILLTSHIFFRMIGFLIDLVNRMTGQVSNVRGGVDPDKALSNSPIIKGPSDFIKKKLSDKMNR